MNERKQRKKNGAADSRTWRREVGRAAIARLAAVEWANGDTLDDLRARGFDVPPSADPDYSLGFVKTVRWYAKSRLRLDSVIGAQLAAGRQPESGFQRPVCPGGDCLTTKGQSMLAEEIEAVVARVFKHEPWFKF